jgi:katanin p60 ATPase-containing subunit A1
MAPDVDLKEVARQTAGYSGDDITNICRDAAMEPVRRKISNLGIERIKEMAAARGGGQPAAPEPDVLLTMADFVSAISKINPSVSPDDIKRHEQYNQQYGAS